MAVLNKITELMLGAQGQTHERGKQSIVCWLCLSSTQNHMEERRILYGPLILLTGFVINLYIEIFKMNFRDIEQLCWVWSMDRLFTTPSSYTKPKVLRMALHPLYPSLNTEPQCFHPPRLTQPLQQKKKGVGERGNDGLGKNAEYIEISFARRMRR